jgi:Zn-dependent protease
VDDYETRSNPVARLAQTSWPLFRAFRVDVRASWTIAVMPLFFAWGFAKWLPLGEAFAWGAAWTAALYAVVWTHEMGHVSMGRRCGIEADRITLRALGGLAHQAAPAQAPKDEIRIALAGPAVHLLWIAVAFPTKWFLADAHGGATWFAMLDGFARLQLVMMGFNLLPVHPLDGGVALRGALALRTHPNRASLVAANVGFVGNSALFLFGLLCGLGVWDPLGFGAYGIFFAWIGIEGFLACRRLRQEAMYGDVYGAADYDPFQKTLLESQAAVREMEAEERRERRVVEDRRRKLQETADRLLDRINELGGIDKLSPRERKELERASRELAEGD